MGPKKEWKLRPHEMYERTFGQVRVALSKKDPGKVEITYAEVLRYETVWLFLGSAVIRI